MRRSTTTCAHAGRVDQGLVEHCLHRRRLPAAPGAVGRQHDLGVAVAQARRQRHRPEAGEQRHQDRADLQHREERDVGLRQVRQVERDDVAAADAERSQRAGEPAHLAIELGISQRALLGRVLALPDQERSVPRPACRGAGRGSSGRCWWCRRRTSAPTRCRPSCRASARTACGSGRRRSRTPAASARPDRPRTRASRLAWSGRPTCFRNAVRLLPATISGDGTHSN